MGYTTTFEGWCEAREPISEELKEYINRFSRTRHMKRNNVMIKRIFPDWEDLCFKGVLGTEGQYFAKSRRTQKEDDSITDYNVPPQGVPGLWCDWILKGSRLVWNGGEKFYNYTEWLEYLIREFLSPNGIALNGAYLAIGENPSDARYIIVSENIVQVFDATYEHAIEIVSNIYSENRVVMNVFDQIKKEPMAWCGDEVE